MSRFLALVCLAASVFVFTACGGEEGDDGLTTRLTSLEITPTQVLAGGTVHVVMRATDVTTSVTVVMADAANPTGGSDVEAPLVAVGDAHEADLAMNQGQPGMRWAIVNFNNELSYVRKDPADANYTEVKYSNLCDPCETMTSVPVVEVTTHGASEIVVDDQPWSDNATAGESRLFFFAPAAGEEHQITASISNGDVDLDLCSTLPCETGSGDLGSSRNAGTAPERIAFDPSVGTTYFLRVTGVAAGSYQLAVRTASGAGDELTVGTALMAQSLAAGATSRFYFMPASTEAHTVFVYSRSDPTPIWSVSHQGTPTQFPTGNIRHSAANAALGQEYAIEVSHQGTGSVEFAILVVTGDGGASGALAAGDNSVWLSASSSAHLLSFDGLADATHTITVSGAFATASFELFSDPALTAGETFGAGTVSCFFISANGNSRCTTTNALTVGATYYLRLTTLGTAQESYGELTVNLAQP